MGFLVTTFDLHTLVLGLTVLGVVVNNVDLIFNDDFGSIHIQTLIWLIIASLN